MTGQITIRLAREADAEAVGRLAALDSRRSPSGRVMLAELDGRPCAAISVDVGTVIADPFQPTAELVALLELRRRQLLGQNARQHHAGMRRRTRFRLRPLLRPSDPVPQQR